MVNGNEAFPTVVRTSRGLTVDGTRLTLYSIMDLLHAEWPHEKIQDIFRLTDKQFADVLGYIAAHREEVEAEYQLVVQKAEENRRYWEERNRERFAEIERMGPLPGKEEAWEKLQAKKRELGLA
jgi:uncharacterized protein (DUF433 family)